MTGRLSAISLSKLAYFFSREERGSRAAFHRRFLLPPWAVNNNPASLTVFPLESQSAHSGPTGQRIFTPLFEERPHCLSVGTPPSLPPRAIGYEKKSFLFQPRFFLFLFYPLVRLLRKSRKVVRFLSPSRRNRGRGRASSPRLPWRFLLIKTFVCQAEVGSARRRRVQCDRGRGKALGNDCCFGAPPPFPLVVNARVFYYDRMEVAKDLATNSPS